MLNHYYALRETSTLAIRSSDGPVSLPVNAPALMLVTAGGGDLQLDGALHAVHYGCLIMIVPGVQAQLRCADPAGLRAYAVQFDAYRLIEQGRDHLLHRRSFDGLPPGGLLATHCDPELAELFRLLHERRQMPDEGSSALRGQRLLMETIERVLRMGEARAKPEEEPIRKAIRHIHEHYRLDLKRTTLAELTGYHPHYFSRKFSQATGLSVTDYIASVRMKKAKEQLLTTASPIHEIARQTGFADALYFSRKFKRFTGVYPTEYRQQPKQIAAFQCLGTLLQLGLRPVGGEAHMLRYSDQLREEIGDMPAFEQWDLDKLEALAPELIVAPAYLRKELIRPLKEIAPVLIQSPEEASPLEMLRTLGQLLGREREAELALDRLQAQAGALRDRLRDWSGSEETVAVYEIAAGRVYVMGRYDRCSFAVYRMLGLRPPESVARHLRQSGVCIMLEPEQWADYAADHMIVSVYEEEGMELTERLLASDGWHRLPAVRRNRVYRVPIGQCWYNDGLSLMKQMQLLERLLLGAR